MSLLTEITFVVASTCLTAIAFVMAYNSIVIVNKKIDSYSSNIEAYAANENDVIELLSDKIEKLEIQITHLERQVLKFTPVDNDLKIKQSETFVISDKIKPRPKNIKRI